LVKFGRAAFHESRLPAPGYDARAISRDGGEAKSQDHPRFKGKQTARTVRTSRRAERIILGLQLSSVQVGDLLILGRLGQAIEDRRQSHECEKKQRAMDYKAHFRPLLYGITALHGAPSQRHRTAGAGQAHDGK
jgi:hypothetical protein